MAIIEQTQGRLFRLAEAGNTGGGCRHCTRCYVRLPKAPNWRLTMTVASPV
jgi:hypothetical protein